MQFGSAAAQGQTTGEGRSDTTHYGDGNKTTLSMEPYQPSIRLDIPRVGGDIEFKNNQGSDDSDVLKKVLSWPLSEQVDLTQQKPSCSQPLQSLSGERCSPKVHEKLPESVFTVIPQDEGRLGSAYQGLKSIFSKDCGGIDRALNVDPANMSVNPDAPHWLCIGGVDLFDGEEWNLRLGGTMLFDPKDATNARGRFGLCKEGTDIQDCVQPGFIIEYTPK